MQREQGVAFIFSSHDPKLLAAADDAVHIHDGRIVGIERNRREGLSDSPGEPDTGPQSGSSQ
jgi:ABC-type glutathione transport system ATPase component